MALVQCPECGGKLSSDAAACPHCGKPNAPIAAPESSPEPKKTSAAVGCLGVILCLVIVGYIADALDGGVNSTTSTQTNAPAGTSSTSEQNTIYARKEANIRGGPSTDKPVIRKVPAGKALKFTRIEGEWYLLSGLDGSQEEWVHQSMVMGEREKRYRDTAPLKVSGWSWGHQHDYAIAEGQVTNVSAAPIENLIAVVSFKTADGRFITSDDALVDYNPILPGQTSPWKVMARWNPAMESASVEFKTMFGGTVPMYAE